PSASPGARPCPLADAVSLCPAFFRRAHMNPKRRRTRRNRLSLAIMVTHRSGSSYAQVMDVSPTGIRVESRAELSLSETVHVAFRGEYFPVPLSLEATVARTA